MLVFSPLESWCQRWAALVLYCCVTKHPKTYGFKEKFVLVSMALQEARPSWGLSLGPHTWLHLERGWAAVPCRPSWAGCPGWSLSRFGQLAELAGHLDVASACAWGVIVAGS